VSEDFWRQRYLETRKIALHYRTTLELVHDDPDFEFSDTLRVQTVAAVKEIMSEPLPLLLSDLYIYD